MGQVRVSRDKESVFQWSNARWWLFEIFFQTIIAGNFFWPSHLSSAKCLNIRHKDSFIPSSLRIWDFDGRIAKCAWLMMGVISFLVEIYNSAIQREGEFPYSVWLEMLKIILWKIWIFFFKKSRTTSIDKKPGWTPLLFRINPNFFFRNSCFFWKNSSQEWGPVFLQTVDRFYFSLVC